MTAYDDLVLAKTPLGYWKLDEPSGTTAADSSGNGRNFTLSGSGITYAATAMGPGLTPGMAFSGAGGVGGSMARASWMGGMAALTIEAWVRPAALNNCVYLGRMNWNVGYSSDHLGALGQQTSKPAGWVVVNNSGAFAEALGSTNHVIGSDYHQAMVYDGATLKVYRNGVEVVSVARTGLVNTADTGSIGLYLAREFSGFGHFNGALSHVAMYASAHSPAEITARYNAGIVAGEPTEPEDLVPYSGVILADEPDLYYTFDELLVDQYGRFPDHSGQGTTNGSVFDRSSSTPFWAEDVPPGTRALHQGQASLVRSHTSPSLRLFGGDGLYAHDYAGSSPTPNTYLNTPTMSASALIKPTRLGFNVSPAGQAWVGYRIMGRMPAHSGGWCLWDLVINKDSKLELRLWRALTHDLQGGTDARAVGATTLQVGQTYHVGASYDGATLKVFVNGMLDGSTSAPGAMPNATDSSLFFGMGQNSSLDDPDYSQLAYPVTFRGYLDEMAYFPTALADARFAAHYTASLAPSETALYQDSFTRANSTSAPGSPTIGGPYTVRAGTWGINANGLYTSVSTAESQLTFPGTVDFDFEIRQKVLGASPGVMFRWVDSNNFWLLVLGASATGASLHRRVAGTYQQQALYSKPPVAGDVYRVVAIGPMIRAYRNGTLIMTGEDQWLSAATGTMGYRLHSDTVTRLDDAMLMSAPADSLVGDVAATVSTPVEIPNDGFLYKGRDTKLADQGAVA